MNKQELIALIKTYAARYIRFNLIGTLVFLIGTTIYFIIFNTFGGLYSWLIANGASGIFQFCLVERANRTRKGLMFEEGKEPTETYHVAAAG